MVLDSSSIVAIFKQEPGWEELERRIDEAATILIGTPTLVETAIVLARLTGRDQRPVLEAWLRRLDARVVAFTEEHYSAAAEAFVRFGRGFNSESNLNFGGCLSYAVAQVAGDELLFTGNDFTHTDLGAA